MIIGRGELFSPANKNRAIGGECWLAYGIWDAAQLCQAEIAIRRFVGGRMAELSMNGPGGLWRVAAELTNQRCQVSTARPWSEAYLANQCVCCAHASTSNLRC